MPFVHVFRYIARSFALIDVIFCIVKLSTKLNNKQSQPTVLVIPANSSSVFSNTMFEILKFLRDPVAVAAFVYPSTSTNVSMFFPNILLIVLYLESNPTTLLYITPLS